MPLVRGAVPSVVWLYVNLIGITPYLCTYLNRCVNVWEHSFLHVEALGAEVNVGMSVNGWL